MRIRQMFSRHYVVMAMGLLLLLGHLVVAEEVQLTLNNGKVIHGELISQTSQTVLLNVVGVETRYKCSTIKQIKKILTPQQEYEAKRAQLKDDDLEGRYKLASWLYYEKKAYNLAEKELVSLKKAFPKDQRIPLLLKIVRNKKAFQNNDSARAPVKPVRPKSPIKASVTSSPTTTPKSNTAGGYTVALAPEPAELLTEDQINLLKVYEVNLSYRPNIRFKRKDLEDFLKANVGVTDVPQNKAQRDYFLNRMEGYQQLDIIFKAKARRFYGKARVLGDPEVFKKFKTIHRTYIQNRCATSDCHGGKEARGIFLFNRRPGARPDDVVYTNFFILNQYVASKNGKQYDMIDRADPQRSLLLQFGMPPEDAVFPHPQVRGMQPAFRRGTEDRQYITILNWIRSLYSPAPDYGVTYSPSAASPTDTPEPLTTTKP